ncbi:PREDICTED: endothelin-3 [Calidris pugnax]|uniref:endothelin-3 n=1 Tax=Calidris pugnax TaxID=198806 RepID=UPI00071CBB53|nr:PREDICTED: endothelin-3 [Calidris pugnax]
MYFLKQKRYGISFHLASEIHNICDSPNRRTVPYGLSNFRGSFRGKRSTGQMQSTFQSSFRCSCLDAHDKQCLQFCRITQDRRRFNVYLLKLRSKNLNYSSPLRWTNLSLQSDARELSGVQHPRFTNATPGAPQPARGSFLPRPLARPLEKDTLYPVTWQGMCRYCSKIQRQIQTSATQSFKKCFPM